jgi:uncharacterized membrane protein HdeD (DUF308 family)
MGASRLSWGLVLAAGLGLVVLGVIALGSTFLTTVIAAVFIGWLVVIGGVMHLLGAFSAGGWGRGILMALVGLVYLLAGWQLITSPIFAAVAITVIIAWSLIISGVFRIAAAFSDDHEHRMWVVIGGALSVLLGVLLWAGWPVTGLFALGLFLGIELLVDGMSLVAMAFDIKREDEQRQPAAA